MTQLDSVISTGKADGVWAIMVSPDTASGLLKTAQEKGIPMLVNGVPEAYGLTGMVPGVTFDTIDYVAQGTAMGEELGNCINEKLDGKADVLMELNAPGIAGKEELESSAKDSSACSRGA